jgi:tRNA threonylcarbamoyl adenosine modification protein YeaZ
MQLSIEAASDEPGVALSHDGKVLLSATWHTQQNHSKELLPNIERLLNEARTDKSALTAVFVDIGPGGYAALRVGVSTAKALAHAGTHGGATWSARSYSSSRTPCSADSRVRSSRGSSAAG